MHEICKMKLLVVAATEFEIKPFINEHNNIEILISGVGIPSTLFNLSKKVILNNYDLVIQAGIAGVFNNRFQKSSVVLVSQDTFGDIGIDENKKFSTLFDNEFANANDFPYNSGWLLNTNSLLSSGNLSVAKGITVNMVTDNRERIHSIAEKFNADIESMEGAAFHYVCLQERINFLQIRSISNDVGERDKTKWEMKKAITNLNIELKKMIQNLI
jgi:futalosine hydrolase